MPTPGGLGRRFGRRPGVATCRPGAMLGTSARSAPAHHKLVAKVLQSFFPSIQFLAASCVAIGIVNRSLVDSGRSWCVCGSATTEIDLLTAWKAKTRRQTARASGLAFGRLNRKEVWPESRSEVLRKL